MNGIAKSPLRHLDLQNNLIADIDLNDVKGSSLRYIDLDGNSLRGIGVNLEELKRETVLKKIYFKIKKPMN